MKETGDNLSAEDRQRLSKNSLLSRRERRALKFRHKRQTAVLAGGVVTAARFRKLMK
jgi:hypothetical protein